MADALGIYVQQLIRRAKEFDCSDGESELDIMRMMAESFDGLMSYLRDMMAGYENDEVLTLLKEMEGVVAREAWDRHEETLTSHTIQDNFDWHEEILAIHKKLDDLLDFVKWIRASQILRKQMRDWDFKNIHIKRRLDKIIVICEQLCNIRYNSDVEEEQGVVGFHEEVKILLDQLTGTSTKQFQIISITGMAGLGKTTLARTLYNHGLVKYTFDFRAWTCVSQVYLKKDLLLNILSSFIDDPIDEYYEMDEHQLEEKLYRKLKGRRYFMVLDDIWDRNVWDDLKMYFPDDKTGSRVLFTSRDIDVALHVQSAKPAHVLRLRTEVESWDIFRKKVFRMGICPTELKKSGCMINKKCEGLPLAIVIAAGVVKNNLSVAWWAQIAANLHLFMVSDPRQYIDSLALSYNHMPLHLRPCFLFFGAFPENYEVPVTKLIWLWIAQGFIHESGSRMLEDVAQDFLMELIKRSLLMTSRMKSDSQVKTCRIHDLLRDFCLRKAEEENFLTNNYRYGMLSSMLCFPLELGKSLQEGGSIHTETFQFLKILDLESILIPCFPLDAVQMANLRYMAIHAQDGSPHESISNLFNLQMLIISSRKNIVVPKTIWNMVNLRHLYIKSGENLVEGPSFIQETEKDEPGALANLQTLSQVSPQSCHNIFSRTPNLTKLGFCGPLISSCGELEFPNLGSVVHLQKLKLLNTLPYPNAVRSCNPIMFPEKLKKLTLSNIGMDWKEMWTFAWLPNLEVLKLKFQACIGERWETGDAEFRKLKVFEFHDLGIKQWICSRNNFPILQRFVVHHCLELNSIPKALGKISTLEVIEVKGCSLYAQSSAVEIQEEQESEGNYFLKVHTWGFPKHLQGVKRRLFLKDSESNKRNLI